MNASNHHGLVSILIIALVFLVLYCSYIFYLFTRKTNGCRRRWQGLDFIWVPMGGITGILILALWWQSR